MDRFEWNLRPHLCQVRHGVSLPSFGNTCWLIMQIFIVCLFSPFIVRRDRLATHGKQSTHLSHNAHNLHITSVDGDGSSAGASVFNVTSAGQCTGVEAAILDQRKLFPSSSLSSSTSAATTTLMSSAKMDYLHLLLMVVTVARLVGRWLPQVQRKSSCCCFILFCFCVSFFFPHPPQCDCDLCIFYFYFLISETRKDLSLKQ